MRILGMRFAPLNVPLRRRVQTLAAATWIVLTGLGNPIFYFLTAYLLLYTQYLRYFVLVYLLWMYYDRDTPSRGGWTKQWAMATRRGAIWRYFCDYFPLRLVKTADLDPYGNYLFCCFPHGVLSAGAFGTMGTDALGFQEKFPGLQVRIITLAEHFRVPFYREFAMSFGGCSANADSLDYLLSTKPPAPYTGRCSVLIVGGASEALESRPRIYRILVKKRRGFIRLALKHGTPLVPVFAFGETDIYDQPKAGEGSILRSMQKTIQKLTGIAPVVLLGRGFFQYSFGIIPQRRPITVVVGKPVEMPKIPEASATVVQEHHERFTRELIEMFEKHKHDYLEDADKVTVEFVV